MVAEKEEVTKTRTTTLRISADLLKAKEIAPPVQSLVKIQEATLAELEVEEDFKTKYEEEYLYNRSLGDPHRIGDEL